MKKYLSIFLVLTTLITLCGCSFIQREEPVTEPETTTEIPIEKIVTKSKWTKTAPAGNDITLKLKKDGTGWESYDDKDINDTTVTWEKMTKSTIKVTFKMDNGTTTATFRLNRDDGDFSLEMIEENGRVVKNPQNHIYLLD